MAQPEDIDERIQREAQSLREMITNPRYSLGNRRLRKATLSEMNRKAMELFCSLEEKLTSQTELKEAANISLMIIYERYKQQYISVAQRMAEWKPKRRKYIEKLLRLIEELDKQFKRFSFLKFIISSVELSGTVLGEIFLGTESGWDKKALQVAYGFGICGTFCLTIELGQMKQILHWASVFVEKDRACLEQFVQWFRNKDMNNTMNGLFPHPMDMEIVRDLQETQSQERCSVNIFMSVLISNLRKDPLLMLNVDFLCNLHVFARSNLALLWWNKAALSRNNIIQNFDSSVTLLGDSVSQMKSMVSHSVPAFIIEQQRFTDISLEQRVMLNLISMCNSYMNLKHDGKSEISSRLRRLRNNMMNEWDDLETIVVIMDRC